MDLILQSILGQSDTHRMERKFLVRDLNEQEVGYLLKSHPAIFREVYPARWVNNIYLDTVDRRHFRDNVVGSHQRYKVRIRWYGDLLGPVSQPALEIKAKINSQTYKCRFPLAGFAVNEQLSLPLIRRICQEADLPALLKEKMKTLRFSLMNRYHRRYFLEANRRYRVTLDNHLKYYPLVLPQNTYLQQITDSGMVVEFKYSLADEGEAHRLIQFFPFRLSRMSKYIRGVEGLEN